MESFHENMNKYRNQLEKGAIQKAYRGLMEYFNTLRMHFKKNFPDCSVSSSVYYGYMDMTYFAVIPNSLKSQKLKVAIVFLHEEFRFEVWLASINKSIQLKYWNLFRESGWNKYTIPSDIKGLDSIIEYILVDKPDFRDLNALTRKIEQGTLKFVKDLEIFLFKI